MSHFSLRLPKSVLSALYGLLCLALVSAFPASGQAQTLTPLHSFDSYGDGARPESTLTPASDGNFYGTTTNNGTQNRGTVYRMTPGGTITTIYSFAYYDGAYPYGKLVQASDGALYGTTVNGGDNGGGTVFKITLGGTLTTLYSFGYASDGYSPYGSLIQASDGLLYGTTGYGGTPPSGGSATGTVFKITITGTPTLTTLYTFTAGSDGLYTHGDQPYAGLVQASDGSFYGTTSQGGVSGGATRSGTVFRITPAGVLTTLHVFTGGSDGANPYYGSLAQAGDGALYGTTLRGGTSGGGTIFKISNPAGTPSYSKVYTFNQDSNTGIYTHGRAPYAGLLPASDGSLYGTTSEGGDANDGGTLFKFTTGGTLTTLYKFAADSNGDYPNGESPDSGLAQGADGALYGTAEYGGPPRNVGTVFKITTGGAFTLLYSFTNGFVDGQSPYGKVIQASDGNFYGTTNQGGVYTQGVVYKMDSAGNVTILHSFNSNSAASDGYYPYGGLVEASDGNLYGTTVGGGVGGVGTVFKISKAGAYVTLHSFDAYDSNTGTYVSDGYLPYGDLIQASDGALYGTTSQGGAPSSDGSNAGTVFKITLGGTLTTLYSFNGSDGYYPYAGLIQASDGNFYGTTSEGGTLPSVNSGSGTVFQITPAGVLTTLHVFTGGSDGTSPYFGSLVQAGDGLLYGTTQGGGAYNFGTVFRVAPNGSAYQTLRSFSGADGTNPYGGLVLANDNNLYGTTYSGGENNTGTIFRLTTTGLLTSLYSFSPLYSGSPDGANPYASLIQANDGNLYGTASAGGTAGYGTVFKINVQVPTVTSFSPTSGGVGATVTITGTGFAGTSVVKFHGTSAAFTVTSATRLTAVVPSGATTGRITVTTPNGIATSRTSFTVLSTPAPAVTGFSPASGAPGTLVALTGSGFSAATGVQFGGVSASFIANSDTQLTAVVPAGATTGPISVTGPGGTGYSLASFTVTASAAPTVIGFSPTSGPVGTLVQIAGTNFTSVSDVSFGAVSASFAVNSENQITAVVPAGAVTAPITVTTATGSAASSASFTVGASTPTVTGFSPTSGPVGTLVQITGTGFTGATRVRFRNTTASYRINSDTLITATVPTGAVTGPISVNAAGKTATSAAFFTVPGTTVPAPVVSSFSPGSGLVGTVVTLSGSGFFGAGAVSFHGTAATTYTVNSDTQITATVPSGATTGTIAVTTPGGTGTSASSFTVIPPVPTVTGFTPTSGPVGTSVTITGTDFTGATSVKFNGAAATTYTVNSATQITATVPTGTTTGTLSVTTPGGTATSSASFTVTTAPVPTITSFTPTRRGVGKTVTITGTNFTGATAVKFNGTAATTFSVDSSTQITATIPVGATTGPISVTTPGGTATSAVSFTVLPPAPTVTGFTPTSGPVGTAVTITGTYFTGASAVSFHGTAATTFSVVSDTQITATVPSGATTGTIAVTTPSGTASSSASYTVTP